MAGVRRRLRDVGARVTGVLGALRDEVVPGPVEPADEAEREVVDEVPGADPSAVEDAPDAEPDTQPDAVEPATGAAAPEPAAAAEEAPAPVEAPGSDNGDVFSLSSASPTAPDEAAPAPSAVSMEPDALCAAAVEVARKAARAEAADSPSQGVGEHLGVEAEQAVQPGDHVVTHSFASTDPAYVGWRWAVTVARAEGSDEITVDEVVLLPGNGALLAPAWVPWSERVRPEDLSPGDLLPPAADDPRLVAAVADPDWLFDDLVWELGLGRPRVLSVEGRLDAAERWDDGETGPDSPRAKAAPGRCGGCGFLVPLGGSLRAAFGACANAMAPDDGRVVSLAHGCGAHSETPVELTHVAPGGMAVDEPEYDVEEHVSGAPDLPADPLPEPADEEQATELGHG